MNRKPPTEKTVARQLAALQRSMAIVYGDRRTIKRTTSQGTIEVKWRSGAAVLEDKEKPEEGRER